MYRKTLPEKLVTAVLFLVTATAVGVSIVWVSDVVGDWRDRAKAAETAAEPTTPKALKLIQVIDGDKAVFQMVYNVGPIRHGRGAWFKLRSPDGDLVLIRPGDDDLIVITDFDPEAAREAAARERARQEHGEPGEPEGGP